LCHVKGERERRKVADEAERKKFMITGVKIARGFPLHGGKGKGGRRSTEKNTIGKFYSTKGKRRRIRQRGGFAIRERSREEKGSLLARGDEKEKFTTTSRQRECGQGPIKVRVKKKGKGEGINITRKEKKIAATLLKTDIIKTRGKKSGAS